MEESQEKKRLELKKKHSVIARDQEYTSFVIGVDPGLKGGVAVFDCDDQKVVATLPIPVMVSGGKTVYDVAELITQLRKLVAFNPDDRFAEYTFCIEQQHALPEQGVVSMFTTGFGFGLWRGIFASICGKLDHILIVKAKEWQSILWEEDAPDETKARSIERVRRLFPYVHLWPNKRKKPHDGIADAVNIAHYAFLRMVDVC